MYTFQENHNMTNSIQWTQEAVFYHIYPLGFCGAPTRNDFTSPPVERLQKIGQWLPHLRSLGVNALYLGPLFESTAHGYDTADYFEVDRRLGTNDTLAALSKELHHQGMRLILDGVFNHVGRDFWAFRDVQQNGSASPYRDWFEGVQFDTRSPLGDDFSYQPWEGHYDLVRLNLKNPDVREYIFSAVRSWIEQFDIDGLRLDVAYLLDVDFLQELRVFCKKLRSDFWLMGEIIHGDYRRLANPQTLDSTTNYEAYKGLYSSLVDKNYFEIAYALNRQFGPGGLYTGLDLYNFVDNHDVDRAASKFENSELLYPLYLLLFTMPGIPSIYYGSEWGIQGKRTAQDDSALRPCLDLEEMRRSAPLTNLSNFIAKLAGLRLNLPALHSGNYTQLSVVHEQLAFLREADDESIIVLLNSASQPVSFELHLSMNASVAVDLLNENERLPVEGKTLCVNEIEPHWGRILKLTKN